VFVYVVFPFCFKKIIMCIRSLFFSSFYVKKENREREMGEVRKQA
jgi:hypothetical protein